MIEHLEETIELPKPPETIKDPAAREYLRLLVNELQRNRIYRLHEYINYILDMTNGGWLYFALPDPSSGVYADGTWRIGVVNNGVEIQKKIGGTWTKKTRQD